MSSLSLVHSNSNRNFIVTPQSLTEAMNFAEMIAKSSLCPPSFKNKGGDVIIAMQMGAEVGLSPMQALQNIAVINGRPCIWGDATLAIVQASPLYVSHREWIEGSEKDGTLTAYCAITRKGQEEYIKPFSQKDAEKAGLWKKPGVWQQYPTRMLQMRARAFCVRDKFSDVLKGLSVVEEVSDYQVIDKQPVKNNRYFKPISVNQIDVVKQEPIDDDIEIKFIEFKESIENCDNMIDLQNIFFQMKNVFNTRKDLRDQLIELKDQKKLEFQSVCDEYFSEEENIIDQEKGEIKNA